jgi:RNA polymerase sigma factor (sigma-70 family)
MNRDTELLRKYVEESSESAFTELVQEHLNLVYSAALRETGGDGASAEDISQAVFTELARKAPSLLKHPSPAGWLYTTVRYLAANTRRAEQRRRNREEKVMTELLSEAAPDQGWQQIRPVLDDALHELEEADRSAVVLRFLESRSLREVGTRLGLEENAARMRVERALEKLRAMLERRGITSTASGLAAAMGVGALTPAPEALAATTVSAALASGVLVGSTTLTVMKTMTLTKTQLSLFGVLLVAGVAVPTWQQTRLQQAHSENARLRATETQPRTDQAELASLRAEMERLRQVETDQAELARLRQWQAQTQPELLRLRGMAGVARRANSEAEQLRSQLARQPTESGTNLLSGAMADAMKQAMQQQVEGRLSRMTASLHLTPEQAQAAREILSKQAQLMSAGMQQVFSGKFDKDELAKLGKGSDPDEQIKALLTPDQQAAYQGYQHEEAAHNARQAANAELLQLESSLSLSPEQEDRVFAALYDVNFNQLTGSTKPSAGTKVDAMQWALEEKAKALEPLLTPAQLENYHQQQAIQVKLMRDVMSKMEGTNGAN